MWQMCCDPVNALNLLYAGCPLPSRPRRVFVLFIRVLWHHAWDGATHTHTHTHRVSYNNCFSSLHQSMNISTWPPPRHVSISTLDSSFWWSSSLLQLHGGSASLITSHCTQVLTSWRFMGTRLRSSPCEVAFYCPTDSLGPRFDLVVVVVVVVVALCCVL